MLAQDFTHALREGHRQPADFVRVRAQACSGTLKTEYLKASIRAKVEHPFRIIKCQFGFTKARYRGLMKNDSKLAMLFALVNIARVDQMLRA